MDIKIFNIRFQYLMILIVYLHQNSKTMEVENQKFLSIVTKGKELFWKYGIRRVSIEEICREAGVSKMTYYKFFRNKNSLAIYLIESRMKDQWKEYRAFWDSDIPMEQKVEKSIRLKLDGMASISNELVQDLYKTGDEEILSFIRRIMSDSLEMVKQDFKDAQKKGEIREDLNIEFILYFMNHLPVMITDEKLTGMYPDTTSMVNEIMQFFFYGIMPKGNR